MDLCHQSITLSQIERKYISFAKNVQYLLSASDQEMASYFGFKSSLDYQKMCRETTSLSLGHYEHFLKTLNLDLEMVFRDQVEIIKL